MSAIRIRHGRAFSADRGGMANPSREPIRSLTALLLAAVLLAGSAQADDNPPQKYPDVIAATVKARHNETFDFDVTVSSPYDTLQRYADGFRVVAKDGTAVYGERKLWHDHATEQPFTRDLYGVRIPANVRHVIIQARDQKFGYGGRTVELVLPGR